MNAQQRKTIRDAHIRRLGGLGAKVNLAGFACILQNIEGASTAHITFIDRHNPPSVPTVWTRDAAVLQPA